MAFVEFVWCARQPYLKIAFCYKAATGNCQPLEIDEAELTIICQGQGSVTTPANRQLGRHRLSFILLSSVLIRSVAVNFTAFEQGRKPPWS